MNNFAVNDMHAANQHKSCLCSNTVAIYSCLSVNSGERPTQHLIKKSDGTSIKSKVSCNGRF